MDGDEHDFRYAEYEQYPYRVIIGLRAKGLAKNDKSGFVLDPKSAKVKSGSKQEETGMTHLHNRLWEVRKTLLDEILDAHPDAAKVQLYRHIAAYIDHVDFDDPIEPDKIFRAEVAVAAPPAPLAPQPQPDPPAPPPILSASTEEPRPLQDHRPGPNVKGIDGLTTAQRETLTSCIELSTTGRIPAPEKSPPSAVSPRDRRHDAEIASGERIYRAL